ncbi:MAG: type II toxin-antitoxin system RelE/ParE family toxin [Bacteroidales bacterium]|nr:type II toxin-antitoxin system RelE/ParE family toxin [Bacteroidales bacterium]
MNKLNLIIENKAESDLELIADYIAKDNKAAAIKMLKQFYKSFEKLSEFPNMGIKRLDFTYKDVKFYVIKKHYLIIYTIIEDSIHILRVLTAYQDICSLL